MFMMQNQLQCTVHTLECTRGFYLAGITDGATVWANKSDLCSVSQPATPRMHAGSPPAADLARLLAGLGLRPAASLQGACLRHVMHAFGNINSNNTSHMWVARVTGARHFCGAQAYLWWGGVDEDVFYSTDRPCAYSLLALCARLSDMEALGYDVRCHIHASSPAFLIAVHAALQTPGPERRMHGLALSYEVLQPLHRDGMAPCAQCAVQS